MISGAAPDVVIGQSTATRAGSASLPAPAKWLGPITPAVCNTNDSTLTEAKAFVSVLFQRASRTGVNLNSDYGKWNKKPPASKILLEIRSVVSSSVVERLEG